MYACPTENYEYPSFRHSSKYSALLQPLLPQVKVTVEIIVLKSGLSRQAIRDSVNPELELNWVKKIKKEKTRCNPARPGCNLLISFFFKRYRLIFLKKLT